MHIYIYYIYIIIHTYVLSCSLASRGFSLGYFDVLDVYKMLQKERCRKDQKSNLPQLFSRILHYDFAHSYLLPYIYIYIYILLGYMPEKLALLLI